MGAQPAKPVWDYHCFLSYSGLRDALNNLPQKAAETAKITVHDHSMQAYCLVHVK